MNSFNSQPPEGGWLPLSERVLALSVFQLTAARRRLASPAPRQAGCSHVSTHSRPKAAGFCSRFSAGMSISFNSQPPEGGWVSGARTFSRMQ